MPKKSGKAKHPSLEDLIASGWRADYENLTWTRQAANADTDRAARRVARRLVARGMMYAAAGVAVIYVVPRLPQYLRGDGPHLSQVVAGITMPPAASLLLAAVWVIALLLSAAAVTRLAARRPRRGAGGASRDHAAASAPAAVAADTSHVESRDPRCATTPYRGPPPARAP